MCLLDWKLLQIESNLCQKRRPVIGDNFVFSSLIRENADWSVSPDWVTNEDGL